jgi:peroxiredoxin Q/BCP
MLEPGHRAPDFSLPSHTGEKIALKDFKGKRLVLYFFPKADTPG